MFYNTGISTYIWIVTNRKPKNRKGKVQLIDASAMWQKMRKSLGSKRKELSEDHIAEITRLFGNAKQVTATAIWRDREGCPELQERTYDSDRIAEWFVYRCCGVRSGNTPAKILKQHGWG